MLFLDRSEEAKQKSKKVLEEQFGGGEGTGGEQGAETKSDSKNPGNVIGGYKA